MTSRGSLAVCLSTGTLLCALGGGCAALTAWPAPGVASRLFPELSTDDEEFELFRQRAAAGDGRRDVLRPIATQAATVSFEIAFVERPVDDPLLGRALWDEIDQIGSLDREVRTRLESNGIRVGICGSRSPAALQKLLGSVPEIGGTVETARTSLRQQTMVSGGSTVFNIGEPFGEVLLRPTAVGGRPERVGAGAGMLAMTARASQPGWAELSFVPQFAMKEQGSPYVATGDRWRLSGEERRRAFRDLKFRLSLGEGEYAVIGRTETSGPAAVGDDEDGVPLGGVLFEAGDEDDRVARLLVLRVVAAEPAVSRRL